MKNNKVKLIIKAKKELSPEELKVFNESLSACLEGKIALEKIKYNLRIMEKYLPYLKWSMKDNFNPKVFWKTMRQLELSEEMLSSYDHLPKELLDTRKIIKSYLNKIRLGKKKLKSKTLSKKKYIPFKEPEPSDKYGKAFVEEAKRLLEEINSDRKELIEREKRNQVLLDSMFKGIPEYENRKKEPVDPLDKVNIWHRRYIEKKVRDKELVDYILKQEKLKQEQGKKKEEQLSNSLDNLTESQIVAEYFIKKLKEEMS